MSDLIARLHTVNQEAPDWVVSFHFASECESELPTLHPEFERWLDAAPDNRRAFAARSGTLLHAGNLRRSRAVEAR